MRLYRTELELELAGTKTCLDLKPVEPEPARTGTDRELARTSLRKNKKKIKKLVLARLPKAEFFVRQIIIIFKVTEINNK